MKYNDLIASLFTSHLTQGDQEVVTLDVNKSSHQERMDILEHLQCHLESHCNFTGFVKLIYFGDGSCTIHAENYWDVGEHPRGFRDKVLLSFD